MTSMKPLRKRVQGLAAAVLAFMVMLSMMPAMAFADDAQTPAVTTWKDLYADMGIDTSKEGDYDAVTSATKIAPNRHYSHIPSVVNKKTISTDAAGNLTEVALDGVVLTDSAEVLNVPLGKAEHTTFEGKTPEKTYGTDEFLIYPDDSTPGYTWNEYLDKIYAVTISDGKTTVGALPWIDWYGEKATQGTHYNKVEIALNSGVVVADNKADVHRFDAFYTNGVLNPGHYTVTVYAQGYAPIVAEDIYVPTKHDTKVSFSNVNATAADMAFDVVLPLDFVPVYTVDGKAAAYESGKLTYDAIYPGNHTVTITDSNNKYAAVNATMVYSVEEQAAAYDKESGKLVAAAGIDAGTFTAYINGISTVSVDGVDYAATGRRGVVKVIAAGGNIDVSKTAAKDATKAFTIVVRSAGYPDLTFTTSNRKLAEGAKNRSDEDVATAETAVAQAQAAVAALTDASSDADKAAAYKDLADKSAVLIAAQKAQQAAQKAAADAAAAEEKAAYEERLQQTQNELNEAKVVDISNYACSLAKASYTYTGKAITPAVTVSGVAAANLTVTYTNNVKVGKATVTITGKDGYKGTITKTFNIVKKSQPMTVKASTKTVKLSKVRRAKQTVTALSVKKNQGKVTYAKVSGSKNLTVNKNNGKITVKKGTKEGTYKVKVKVSAAGNATHNAGNKTVTVTVRVR